MKETKFATEQDAVQALGLAVYKALDFGIGEKEERPLSPDLENLIYYMTYCEENENDESQNADDEGIEKDAEDDLPHRASFRQVELLCVQHHSNENDALQHYKAVCRALAAEAQELTSFLDNISKSEERISVSKIVDDSGVLDDLKICDWARLWVQVMRELRRGVRLKKVEQVHLPLLEYELTPFEMLLEDIRSCRYSLNKIMVNGDIPPKVKSDAHAVILDFIRSRPPLHSVKKRELKSPPRTPLDPHQSLMKEIRSSHELKPVRNGRLLVETSRTKLNNKDDESPLPIRRVIKPDFNLILNNSFETSQEIQFGSHWDDELSESSDSEEEDSLMPTVDPPALSPDLCVSSTQLDSAWHQAVTRDLVMQDRDPRLSRRHTIMVCQSPEENKVVTQQELPPLEKEDSRPNRFPWMSPSSGNVQNKSKDSSPSDSVPKWRASLSQKSPPSSPSKSSKLVTIAEDNKPGGHRLQQGSTTPSSSKLMTRRGILKRQENTSKSRKGNVSENDVCDSGDHDLVCELHDLNADQLMHVSWKSACSRRATNGTTARCEGCRPISKHWQNPIECLSLTLEEVIHIRSVLTKAELESLLSRHELYNLVNKGKVCFTCKITRFSLFGQWGTKCKLCKRNVCNKCLRKMNVPTEHFQNIPVYTLSPTPLGADVTEAVDLIVGTGSKPTSPGPERKQDPIFDSKGRKKILVRSKSVNDKKANSQSLKGPLMNICCDCKTMITEIIRASRTSIALINHDKDIPQKVTSVRTVTLESVAEHS